MVAKKQFIPLLFILIIVAAGCSISGDPASGVPNSAVITPSVFAKVDSPTTAVAPPSTDPAPRDSTIPTQQAENTTQLPLPTSTITPTPTGTEVIFEVGEEITIDYLRDLEITGSEITFEEQLPNGANYYQHLVSYISEGNKIFGLLTIPFPEPPEGGYKAIVFNHGYIPPAAYRTTERYTAYVDHLASNGFVVLKIDYRGHGQSQGEPSGTYFSSAYTIDAIAALKSLQTMDIIDPQGIGMWGHSMAGNLVLRAMLIEPDIKAGVIWAGAVYSYDDFAEYGITDNTYRPPATPQTEQTPDPRRGTRAIFETYGRPDTQVDYWKAVSLTENIQFLNSPLQIHHAQDDTVVTIGYSHDLAAVLQENGKQYDLFSYEGGGHNLISPYFNQAIQRTVNFFRDNL
jgi:dipeptidyl aminopeptidase/acylaminoacyl peptidase